MRTLARFLIQWLLLANLRERLAIFRSSVARNASDFDQLVLDELEAQDIAYVKIGHVL